MNLVEHLFSGRHANAVAYRVGAEALRYGELLSLVNRTGCTLRTLGIEREQRVALVLRDSLEFVTAFCGALKIGAVAVPLNTLWRPEDLAAALDDCRARALVVDADLWSLLAPHCAGVASLRSVLLVGDAGPDELSYAACLAAAGSQVETAPTRPHDWACWLYSSGSTGAPKAVMHGHADFLPCIEGYASAVLGLRDSDVVLSAAKLFFAYGLGNSLYFPLACGASTILVGARPEPQLMLETIARERPTVFFGVPTLYAAMLHAVERGAPAELSSLRLCVSAGEALPAEIFERWKARFDLEILDGIGSTEALHIFISNRPGQARAGSSGVAVPGYELRIVDDQGQAAAHGEIGNLHVRGGSTASGYYGQRERTQQTMLGPWLVTGDKYAEDDQGYFQYAGRSDDMLKVGGIWVSPVEVEAALITHPAVLEAAVVGQADEQELIKPRAFVVLKDRSAASETLRLALQQHVKQRLAPYKYPRWIDFVELLPKTATGKIQRFRLRGADAAPR